ncbi:MAG: hypothetical protein HY482_01665 [Candidatus Wildermuthbacteria bacterium]|nr:hypothetical protein [Candidatus Wildermuthbacteria bacterium]
MALRKKKKIGEKREEAGNIATARVEETQDDKEAAHKTRIRVIGIGGGGGSIVGEIAKTVERADFVSANTDIQALRGLSKNVRPFIFGEQLTRGMGCGMDEALGEQAARAEKERIKKLVEGQDICVFISSLGGGTGSGSSLVFAEAAREAHCLAIGVFTMPFYFEGTKRKQIAESALARVIPLLNAHLVIPNENIFRIIEAKTPLKEAFSAVNKRLAEILEGFIDTLALPGLINIDFADIKTLLEGRGRLAFLNSARVQTGPKMQMGIKDVLANPLLDYGIIGADRVVLNITGDKNMKMQEVAEISKSVTDRNLKAKIIFGLSFESGRKEMVRVSLFAVGCNPGENTAKEARAKAAPAAKKKSIKKQGQKKPVAARKDKEKEKEKDEQRPLPLPVAGIQAQDVSRVRRNALDVKKAQDEEMKDLEKKEQEFDIPAFLRKNKL